MLRRRPHSQITLPIYICMTAGRNCSSPRIASTSSGALLTHIGQRDDSASAAGWLLGTRSGAECRSDCNLGNNGSSWCAVHGMSRECGAKVAAARFGRTLTLARFTEPPMAAANRASGGKQPITYGSARLVGPGRRFWVPPASGPPKPPAVRNCTKTPKKSKHGHVSEWIGSSSLRPQSSVLRICPIRQARRNERKNDGESSRDRAPKRGNRQWTDLEHIKLSDQCGRTIGGRTGKKYTGWRATERLTHVCAADAAV